MNGPVRFADCSDRIKYNHRHRPSVVRSTRDAFDIDDCQSLCRRLEYCKTFSYR